MVTQYAETQKNSWKIKFVNIFSKIELLKQFTFQKYKCSKIETENKKRLKSAIMPRTGLKFTFLNLL